MPLFGKKQELEKNKNTRNFTDSSLTRKIIFLSLFLFAAFVIGIELLQLRNSINKPFEISNNEQESVKESTGGEFASQDTDGDGLSDKEEKEIYSTSSYMKDTDSDGINDKKEIDQDTDPNCPQGKECNSQLSNTESDNKNSNQEVNTVTSMEGNNSSPSSAIQSGSMKGQDLSAEEINKQTLQSILKGKSDADTLRKALKEAGMDEKMLKQISDKQLMEGYQQSLNNFQQ